MRRSINTGISGRIRGLGVVATASACVCAAGCNNAGQGAGTGAAIGALSGLAIGSLSGNAGTGAAIGAIAGGVGGAVIGDQNERNAQNSVRSTNASPPPPAPVESRLTDADRDRLALRALEGGWTWSGWSEFAPGERRALNGGAVGTVYQAFFLRIDLDGRSRSGSGDLVTGSLTFGSEPGRGVTLEAHTSNAPVPARFTGSTSADRRTFTFLEDSASVDGVLRRMSLRILSDNEWVIDVQNIAAAGSPTIGSFTFSRTR